MSERLAPIKFGTDGWRAIIAQEFTFANVERVAQAYADYLATTRQEPLLNQLVAVGQVSRDESQSAMFREVAAKASGDVPALVVVGYDRRANAFDIFLQALHAQLKAMQVRACLVTLRFELRKLG